MRQKQTKKLTKLVLNRQTLRLLTATELERVAGGLTNRCAGTSTCQGSCSDTYETQTCWTC